MGRFETEREARRPTAGVLWMPPVDPAKEPPGIADDITAAYERGLVTQDEFRKTLVAVDRRARERHLSDYENECRQKDDGLRGHEEPHEPASDELVCQTLRDAWKRHGVLGEILGVVSKSITLTVLSTRVAGVIDQPTLWTDTYTGLVVRANFIAKTDRETYGDTRQGPTGLVHL